MARCPKCGGNIPASAISGKAAAAAIACPHCRTPLEVRLRNRMAMNLAAWGFAAVMYTVLVLAGVDRGMAFSIGLIAAIIAGYLLLRFARKLSANTLEDRTPSARPPND